MDIFKSFLSDLWHALKGGCWLNHRWQIVKDDGTTLEQVCQKCGKRQVRQW